MSLSLVAYEDSSDSETEEVPVGGKEGGRSDSKPDRQSKEDVRKLLAVLPPAKGVGGRGRSAKQPVRIGIPKLENEGDSDEEGIPVVKKPRMQGRGTGLTALLPEPKGAPRLLGAANKPTTKSMVPYSLTKKKQESKQPLPKSKVLKKKADSKNEGDDSDSDGEPVSFFSHLEDSQRVSTPLESDPAGEGDNVSKPDSSFPESGSTYPVMGYRTYGEPTGSNVSQSQWYAGQYDTGAQNSEFMGQTDPSTHTQGYRSGYTEWTEQSYSNAQEFASGYTGQYTDMARTEGGGSESGAEAMPGPGPGLSIDEEVLRRLAGGSRLRGKEKDLRNVIEINEEEVKEGIKVYQKYHTDDSLNKLYQPDLSKVAAPSSMQKRKHQLGYLAHQAKARELELRNHWAQASATRRQTQMKYGF